MSELLDVDTIVRELSLPNPAAHLTSPDPGLCLDEHAADEFGLDSATWVKKVHEQQRELGDPRALKLSREITAAKRRTLSYLSALGYHNLLSLWREDTLGLTGIIDRFENETGERFSASLLLDFMESHESWSMDLESIHRHHGHLHEANWQKAAEDASDLNMVSVARAKQISQLAFERASTLNREKYGKVAPRDEMAQGTVINVTVSKDGVNSVGPEAAELAQRQQMTARARVKYGTGQYVDPVGLSDWQHGRLDIPADRVDDYLMLKWLPPAFNQVVPDAHVPQQTTETAISSPVNLNKDSYTLDFDDLPE